MILPTPMPDFEWRATAVGPALVCGPLERHAAHLFTTRDWRLGQVGRVGQVGRDGQVGSNEGEALAWGDVASAIGVSAERLVRLRQVHGNAAVVAEPRAELSEADITMTDDPSLAIAVQAADCVPLLMVDQATYAVAAAHAGWRGMAARVPEATVRAMRDRFGTRAADLIVAAGPSIGACCYEVGPDVRDAFVSAGFSPTALARWFLAAPASFARNPPMAGRSPEPRADHWYFDGWRAIRDQLEEAGVASDRIHMSELCTASHADTFCSYRRDGVGAGRMAAAISARRRESDHHV